MGSMKYLWVSLGRSNKMRIAMYHLLSDKLESMEIIKPRGIQ